MDGWMVDGYSKICIHSTYIVSQCMECKVIEKKNNLDNYKLSVYILESEKWIVWRDNGSIEVNITRILNW